MTDDKRWLLDELYEVNIRRNRQERGDGIFNMAEHIANLPDPAKDEKPPAKGQLTKEEVAAIRKEKKETGSIRRKWSGPAEEMVIRILISVFNAKNLVKTPDRMQEITQEGQVRRFYANAHKPDISMAVQDTDGEWKDGYCEVKSCAPGSASVALNTGAIVQQSKFMDKHPNDVTWWAFVFWQKRGEARVWVAPHDRVKDLQDRILPQVAEEDKKFQGKSLRLKDCERFLADCEIIKVNRRWKLRPGHWYAR